ncbi:hypothetical protein [Streptomyces sp. NPDC056683]|uniref:hypothetical protein n=1 Tax=Streptomyces sp. NPDC056683 TaxID=3345910 RepID=UPI00368B8EF9
MALYIVHAVDDDGHPYDESVFEPGYFDAAEYGGDAAAEAAANEEFEWAVANYDSVAWALLRVGVPAAPAGGEVPAT